MSNKCTFGGTRSRLCQEENCQYCFNRSFASHERAISWSQENLLLPRNVPKGSGQRVKFDCDTCKHTFEADLRFVTNRGRWCNFCSNKVLCRDNTCQICYAKSFACDPRAASWSKDNALQPREVFKCSAQKIKFDCDVCKHTFEVKLYFITNQNAGCNYCSSNTMCSDTSCKPCFDRSFASCPNPSFGVQKIQCFQEMYSSSLT